MPSRQKPSRRNHLCAVVAALVLASATSCVTPAFADAAEDCGKGGEAAVAACSELIDKDANDGAAYINRGKAYLAKGDNDRALADFTEAIAIDPTDAKAYFNRGSVYLTMDKTTEAAADLQQALSLDPDYEEAKAALEKAVAGASPAAASGGAASEPEAQASVDDKNSALSALNGKCANCGETPGEPSPLVAPGNQDSASTKPSGRMDFVPSLPDTPSGDEPNPDSIQPKPAWPTIVVAAKNYADETTDWGVNQQTVLKKDVGKKTPMSLPGARRVTTPELQQIGPQSLLIDVLDDTDHHITLPGAVHIPGGGDYGGGKFTDKLQKKFAKVLAELTNDNLDRQLVFFCYGAECWESYNAALRAINIGFHNVLWYRGGLESWKDAELPSRRLRRPIR